MKHHKKHSATQKAGQPGKFKSAGVLAVGGALLVVAILVFVMQRPGGSPELPEQTSSSQPGESVAPPMSPSEATFVGAAQCAQCHQAQYQDWQGSHHDLAMQEANAGTVLGDFDNARFSHGEVTTEFFQRDGQFWVKTDGTSGELEEFQVQYVFGVFPLQQYLLPLPGGRLQALSIAWDSRLKEQGGQRWFHLYQDEVITYDDPLHWTKPAQNWNYMCAECHSTHLQKQYNPASDTYNTEFAEIDVACEACHGPGSNHVMWADDQQGYANSGSMGLTHLLNERAEARWHTDPATGQPLRSEVKNTDTEIEVCAACHSRRSQMFEDDRKGQPFTDGFAPALLEEGLYHPDGQILEEVYVYGSFLQSKMYAAGVTCSDCHNPHSLEIKLPGNGVCLQCHQADAYNVEEHHHHPVGSESAQCVNCHMADQTFMGVDDRRDHSFRIPRPDRTVSMQVPNACNQCHEDQTPQWAADAIHSWYPNPNPGYQQFAETLFHARQGKPGSEQALQELVQNETQPAIARATAAQLLQDWPSAPTIETLAMASRNRDPLLRLAALEGMRPMPIEQRWQLAHPMLKDSSRVVRAMAANRLADAPASNLSQAQKFSLEQAAREYVESQKFNADTPQAHVNLGGYYQQQGFNSKAEKAYRRAIEADPNWVPSYVNLADLYRSMQQDDKGFEVLQAGISRHPDNASLHHSLGLLHVRLKQPRQALAELGQAVALAPQNGRYRYVYAVALHSYGDTQTARQVIDEGLALGPDNALQTLRLQLQP
ncbi:hypothetical protein DXV75_04355 [Alteromonas aestuariivivens]|uniref:Cytochrome c-552/4 domain-containing protein n=1 Tax=Alteromonas aestuariivivens TaxID=1938339 RepID=A0A3D8MCE4_9ALTE|nr:tetratricopeptide repeat protein [Alteromonas aestuariivivens]RDV28194.1 hypothetical protein DXV75_04355 [Alteromonas aestuariivivens]